MQETPKLLLLILITINVIKNYSLIMYSKVKRFLIILSSFFIKIVRKKWNSIKYGQLAWKELKCSFHQRLHTENSNIKYNLHNHSRSINRYKLDENKDNFYQWLVGFTDGDGSFSLITRKSSNGTTYWSLFFKIGQSNYNLRALYYIKRELGIGHVYLESKTNNAHFEIRNTNLIVTRIIPIFDKYPLLTKKYYNYKVFKAASQILINSILSKEEKDKLLFELKNKNEEGELISPEWGKINFHINNTDDAKRVISKYWLIGFTEAEGSFYLVSKSPTRIVHAFEITQKLDIIVLKGIASILGISVKSKKTYNTVVTTNSRSILNIINYYEKTMKGMKALEFKIWSKSFFKYKGNYVELKEVREKLRNIRSIRLDKNCSIVSANNK